MLILRLYDLNSINHPNLMGARRSCGQLGYEIGRMLGNEFKVELKVTITYLRYVIITPWKVI